MTTRDTQPKRLPLKRARLIAAAVSAAAGWVPNGSHAQPRQELPTGFEIEERPIQKAPTTFKFQSRISQAKMPVGSQTFTTLYVNLVRGESDVLCSEQLNQVQVRDSVLNIEIGRGFNCALDDIIATNNDLNFQICIQSKENCLKPIALSSVPYAIKATFSQQAQESHTADIAAQCHYAHRVTADTGLLSVNNQSQYGYGYYDFATPVAPNSLSALAMPTGVTTASGFLQWTPVNAMAQKDLTVCSRTHDGTELSKLDVFNVQAANSYFSNAVFVGTEAMGGYLAVDGHAHIVGDIDAQNGSIRGDAQIGRDLSVGQDAHVVRDTSTGQDILVGRDAHVTGSMDATDGTLRNDLSVLRHAHVTGNLDATDGTLRNDLTVQRHAHVTGNMDAENGTLRNDLAVQRHAHVTGDLDAQNGAYRGSLAVNDNISISAGGLTAAGDVSARNAFFSKDGTFAGDLGARHATFNGNVNADGNVTGVGTVRGNRLVSDTSVTAASVTATGNVTANSATVTGNLTVDGNVTAANGMLRGRSLVSDSSVSAASVTATGQVSAGSIRTTGGLQAGDGNSTGFVVTPAGKVTFYDAPTFPNGVVFPAAKHNHPWSDLTGVPGGLTALAGLACSSGQIAKWGPSGWSCGADTDTTYSAGPGIAVSNGQISLNGSGCSNGQILKFNSASSTWACAADTDTTYSAGSGITVNNGQISLNGSGCSNGQMLKFNSTNNTWTCQADNDSPPTAGAGITVSNRQISLNSTGCATGQLLKFNSSNNTWSCQGDNDNGITQANADARYVKTRSLQCPAANANSTLVRSPSNAGGLLCVYEMRFDPYPTLQWHGAADTCRQQLGANVCTWAQGRSAFGWDTPKPNYWLSDRVSQDEALATKADQYFFGVAVGMFNELPGAYCCIELRNPFQ